MYESDDEPISASKVAKQVFDTPDLVRLIYSFGDPDHRRLIRIIGQEIKYNPTEIWDQYWKRRPHVRLTVYTIYDYLREMPRAKLMKLRSATSRCYCCQRHSRKKPSIYGMNGSVTETHETICGCTCRGICRRALLCE
jgi:hypothetical protein